MSRAPIDWTVEDVVKDVLCWTCDWLICPKCRKLVRGRKLDVIDGVFYLGACKCGAFPALHVFRKLPFPEEDDGRWNTLL